MPARLKDIAAALGLSVTTVSRALAGYDDVSEETRRRVREAAEAMGYVPDATARRLQKQRTGAIGFIVPTFGPRFADPFFSELLAGIGNEAARWGYELLTSTVAPGPQELDVYRSKVLGRLVDGVVVVRTRRQDARVAFLLEQQFPFVCFGRTNQSADFPWVDIDGAQGVRQAVDYLVSLGHRRIGYIRGPEELMFTALRWQGFCDAMAAHGLSIEEKWIVHGDLSQGDGRVKAGQLLDRPERPTALITGNDLMALGAIAAAQERGLVVGRDLSIIGFDDIPPAEQAHPPLTTIHQPIYQIATRVTGMLLRMLEGQLLPERQVLLTPELVRRRSTGPPADG
jgi:LacI family transcriptional regulator